MGGDGRLDRRPIDSDVRRVAAGYIASRTVCGELEVDRLLAVSEW